MKEGTKSTCDTILGWEARMCWDEGRNWLSAGDQANGQEIGLLMVRGGEEEEAAEDEDEDIDAAAPDAGGGGGDGGVVVVGKSGLVE